ncbi:MAG: hypothetical protein ACRD2W_23960 [Acidimicrobiales bacterium]
MPDAIDRASASFWNPPSLDQLMADVAPLSADEDFSIGDLTEQEWEVFADALHE